MGGRNLFKLFIHSCLLKNAELAFAWYCALASSYCQLSLYSLIFTMGVKTFINQTAYPLNLVLTVRAGNTPGDEAGTQEFELNPSQSESYTYSEGNVNPYLDGLVVAIDSAGNIIASQQAVTIRSSSVDDALNMNDTLTFSLQGQSLVVGYSNS